MNEPLNTSASATNFTGKTYNSNPLWHSQPLRLTPTQTQNPNLVLNDFFECYHLHEVREIMWQWVTEAVSSPHSRSNDPHERNNYLFFYEKMESLVEAAWIMNRGIGRVANPGRQAPETVTNERVDTTVKATQSTRFSKPARLIEKVATEPAELIAEVFSHTTLKDLHEYLLPSWLRVALINTQSLYSAARDREILYEFYEQLLPFVEALYVSPVTDLYHCSLYLNKGQSADPSTVITTFFQQFSIDYVRRELSDFMEAGIGYEGNYPNGFTPWQAWMSYNHMLCLAEAAYQLYINQQMETVSNVLSQQPVELVDVNQ